MPGLQDLGYSGDTLASLRGTENLLLDLIECPDYVREFDKHLIFKFKEVYDKLYDIVSEDAEGSVSWLDVWHSGRFYPTQNDFSYMISKRMFIDIFIPGIETQANFLDKIQA